MKRIIALVLSVFLLALCLTGCGEKSALSPKDPVTLTLWHVYGEQADSPMNRLVEEFNATVGLEKGVVVAVTNVTSTSKIANQLVDAMEEKPGSLDLPDLFSCHTNTAVLLGSEQLLDWNTRFTQEELSAYVPEFLQDGTKDGKLVVFPVSKSSYALFINGSQFERFSADTGVTYDDLETWEGFFDAAARYYEWSGGKTFCAMDYLIRHMELDILARGGELTYTKDGWYNEAAPQVKDSWMRFALPLVQGHIAVSDLYANTQVMTGEALCGIGSTAALGYYNSDVIYPDNTTEPANLHVLPLPKSGSGQQYMPQTGVGLAACVSTEQKAEAAAVFVRWMTEGQRNLDYVVETGYMPVHNDAFAAISDYDFPSEGHASLYKAIQAMRQDYIPVVRPDFDGYYDMVNALYDGLRQLQAELPAREEAAEVLAEETWDLFCSIR